MYKSGFVAVLGKPSSGKSSLVNLLVGFDVALVNPKPQTTRFNIKGIMTTETSQIIFVDTPGVHIPKHKLGKYMMKGVRAAAKDVDVILYLVDAKKPFLDDANSSMIDEILKTNKKIVLAINKVDDIKKENILRIMDEYNKYVSRFGKGFETMIPISVYNKEGIDDLVKTLEDLLPEGEKIFDEDDVTDISERDIVCEIIRGNALKYLNEEIPHGINVNVENMKSRETENGNTVYDIEAEIICSKDSHKPIIIGKDGAMLKRIISKSSSEIKKLLENRVNLKVWVKVRRDWENNETFLKNISDKLK